MTTLSPKLTNVGLALFPVPALPGFQVQLTHMALGTGRYVPNGTEIALQAEVARYPILPNSSTKPTPTQVQISANIINLDPNGHSPNGQWIGEIGFYSGNTLFAIWSQATNALFYKTADFDVPIAYTLDISALPASSVTVQVSSDAAGMGAMILAHEAEADPHPQYFSTRNEVMPGGLTQQFLRKKSNVANDWEWVDLTSGLTVNVNTKEESQLLAAAQTIVTLTLVTTNGMVAYIGGGRLDKGIDFTPDPIDLTKFTLTRSYPLNTKITIAQNEVAGQIINPLDRTKNFSDILDVVLARKNLGVSAAITGVPLMWPTLDCPSWAVVRDGSALTRSAYSALFPILCPVRTGTIALNAGGAIITGLSRTSDLWVGMPVEHANLPAGTTIKTVDSASQITLSANATAALAGAALIFFLFGYGSGGGATTFGVQDDRGLFERALDSGSRGYEKTVISGTTNSTTAVSAISSTRGLFIGQGVAGVGIQVGTTITGISLAGITLSLAATTSVAGNALTVTGGQVGNERADDFKSHSHGMGYSDGIYGQGQATNLMGSAVSGLNTFATGGAETRPRFRDYLPIIAI